MLILPPGAAMMDLSTPQILFMWAADGCSTIMLHLGGGTGC
jgi:hypothetical protein